MTGAGDRKKFGQALDEAEVAAAVRSEGSDIEGSQVVAAGGAAPGGPPFAACSYPRLVRIGVRAEGLQQLRTPVAVLGRNLAGRRQLSMICGSTCASPELPSPCDDQLLSDLADRTGAGISCNWRR
jgi:hypothetical protein